MTMLDARCWLAPVLLWAGATQALDYPESPRGKVVDDYHGSAVADPYRWLEDPDAPATRDWIAAQNALTESVLSSLPARDRYRQRLQALWNYPKTGAPQRRGDRYFYQHNDGLQNQPVLMVREGLAGEPRALLDPNALAADGTTALTVVEPSPDGRLLAYGLAEAGSDWNRFRIRDVKTGRDLPEVLEFIKFSGVSWTHDGRGFFYSRFPGRDGVFDELANQQVYYHRVGTPQAQDRLIYSRPDQPRWNFDAQVTSSGRYLTIAIYQGATENNALYIMDLQDPRRPRLDANPRALISHFRANFEPLGNRGSSLLIRTTDQAPRGRIIAMDLARPQPAYWRELVPQGEDTLELARYVGGRLVLVAMHDAVHRLSVHGPDGVWLRDLALPGLGSVSALSGQPDATELFFEFESYLQPESVYRADVRSGAMAEFARPAIAFDATRFVTEQVFFRSKDGTRVPMFITHARDRVAAQPQPTYLYGYGGFNISLTPSFSVARAAWLEAGGILAVANLRGGGEYGEAWHEAGTRDRKQNVFDDFIAAAEYLIDQGWTRPSQLAIAGGSNGGLLVGAVLNQRPELFAAALPAVGVMDMLRFHKFTIGWAWVGDYGSADNAEDFPYLRAYSPLHNLKSGAAYPAVLITTGDHDDRVVPGHSFKYAAALQHAQGGSAPTLIRIETRGGHGRGTPTSKRIAAAADQLAFIEAYTRGVVRPAPGRTNWSRLIVHSALRTRNFTAAQK